MRYIITIALLFLATPSFAVLTRTYTIKESGGDYSTLASAEAAHDQDYVANDSALTFEISGTWSSADAITTWNGSVCDGTRFPTIIAVGDSRATGTWSTTAYRVVGASGCLIAQDEDITFDGIQVHNTHVGGSFFAGISSTATGRQIVQNCVVKANLTGTNTRGIFMNAAGSGSIIRNNVVFDCNQQGIYYGGAAGGLVDNNTVENVNIGIGTATGDAIARNNIVVNVTTPFNGDFNGSTDSEENYTDNASISYGSCGSCGTGDQLSQSADPFVDLAGENYHLAAGSAPINTGKDLSADFTTDIDGDTRDANFDKGADEFIVTNTKFYKKVKLRKVGI